MSKKDGGPAFPTTGVAGKDYEIIFDGMSLRDYFAGQALVSLAGEQVSPEVQLEILCEAIAISAYQMADAMLAERQK